MNSSTSEIWTIGHSTRGIDDFIKLLLDNQIEILADVRHYPASRRYPHFNKAELATSLATTGIRYEHLVELGGRRTPRTDSRNTRWRNAGFRGYADYMETTAFGDGIDRLRKIAEKGRTAIMCSEAVWWRCHRSMIADYLKAEGWSVLHIMGAGTTQLHPYTDAAQIVNGRLSYRDMNTTLFNG